MPLVTSDWPSPLPPSGPTQAGSGRLDAQWEPGVQPPAQPSLARQLGGAGTPIGREGWAGSEEFKCGRNELQSIPPSGLPQGRRSVRSSREHAWQLIGSQRLLVGVSPAPPGPPASAEWPLPTLLCPWPFSFSPSPLSLSSFPALLFEPEAGPPDLGDSFLFLPLLPPAPHAYWLPTPA